MTRDDFRKIVAAIAATSEILVMLEVTDELIDQDQFMQFLDEIMHPPNELAKEEARHFIAFLNVRAKSEMKDHE